MSLLKKHEKPQSNTASFTMVPSLHSKLKSLELHWAYTVNGVQKSDTKVNEVNAGIRRIEIMRIQLH